MSKHLPMRSINLAASELSALLSAALFYRSTVYNTTRAERRRVNAITGAIRKLQHAQPKASKHEAALVKAFKDFAQHLRGCNWGGWMTDKIDKCDCGLSAAVRACPPLRKALKMKAIRHEA